MPYCTFGVVEVGAVSTSAKSLRIILRRSCKEIIGLSHMCGMNLIVLDILIFFYVKQVHIIATKMSGCWTDIKTACSVLDPAGSFVGAVVNRHLKPCWYEGCCIEIKFSIYLSVCTDSWIDTGW